MAYDSDGSFDDDNTGDTGDTGDASASTGDDAASAATSGEASLLATEAAAMAGASMASESAPRGGSDTIDGWDAPTPSAMGVMPSAPSPFRFDADDDDAFLYSDDADRQRDRGTSLHRVKRWFSQAFGTSTPTEKGRAIAEAALRAYTLHPDACQQSTAEVAAQFGLHELDGLSANDQAELMRAGWRAVQGEAATSLVNGGRLVVAALAAPGRAGHTAVVVPGDGVDVDGRFYPNVCGGGYPFRRSDGSKTAADVWTPQEREQVRYFTPQ